MDSIKLSAIFCVVFIFNTHNAICQSYSVGLIGGIGNSKAHVDAETVEPSVAYKAGMFLSVPFNDVFEIWTSLNYTHLGWKEVNYKPLTFGTDIINAQNGMPTYSYIRTRDEFKLNYVAVPLMIRFHKKRFAAKGGLNFMVFSMGSYDAVRELSESGNVSTSVVNNDIENKKIKGDWGPMIAIEYNVFKNIWLAGDFFYGFNKVNIGVISIDRNISHFTIGLNYYLTKTDAVN